MKIESMGRNFFRLTSSESEVPLDGLVQILVHESLRPEPVRLFILRCIHVHTPAIPDDIGSGWEMMSFKGIILDERMSNFGKRYAEEVS